MKLNLHKVRLTIKMKIPGGGGGGMDQIGVLGSGGQSGG